MFKRRLGELMAENDDYKALHEFLRTRDSQDARTIQQRIQTGEDPSSLVRAAEEGDLLLQASRQMSLMSSPQSTEDDNKSSTDDSHPRPSSKVKSELSYSTKVISTTAKGHAGPTCFNELLSWRTCCRPGGNHVSGEIIDQSTTLTLPPIPLDSYTLQTREDTWTRTGWTLAHIRHLLDVLNTWDYLPFCLMSKDLFLQDYLCCSDRFCSSALVHALLAIATRLINERNDDEGYLPSGWLRSKLLFDEAEACISNGKPGSLPDVQACGILSLYLLRSGQEARAQKVAEDFRSRIGDLCQSEPLAGKKGSQYASVSYVTYRSAVSLVRMISLTTGHLFTDPNVNATISPTLDQPTSDSGDPSSERLPRLATSTSHAQLWNDEIIATKLFQLTEWVYALAVAAQPDPRVAIRDLQDMYGKCLDWYEGLFASLNASCNRTPFVLFCHMYFHFSLLCAFRPFIGMSLELPDLQPFKLCTQAAQSVLALAQSYEDLFTLQRVSGFIPYFVCASGLFSLAMEDSRTVMDPVYLHTEDAASISMQAEPEAHGSHSKCYSGKVLRPYVKIPAVTHARLLLAKMGSSHPEAAIAGKVLQDEIESARPCASTRFLVGLPPSDGKIEGLHTRKTFGFVTSSALPTSPSPPPSQQQEEHEEWDGLSDTGSSSQVASLPIPSPPIPGPAMVSVDALQSHVNEFAKENGFGVVRHNGSGSQARKTRYVFQCDRYGEPRTARGAGLRQRRSRKCGCKWKVIAEALERNDYTWTLRAFADPQHSQHNHDRTTSRRVGIRARDVRGIVREKHPGTLYTRKDIYNARALLVRQKLDGLGPTAALIKLFDEKGIPYIVKWSVAEPDRLVGLIWTYPYCLRMWKRFPETMGFDNTYNTNRFKLPLFQVTGQTCLKSVYNAAFGLIDNEKREGFQFLAEGIRQMNDKHDIPLPEVVITDYDKQMKADLSPGDQ
ncbi:hypothetical protein HIM_12537 [Hirsutella minnesotensis 3608]|uniref:MULE transposase domain-containing protein n=1 Tax=Hirsutella minnesotensis 3608 TaxID=1043627 RepID=A0A0F7ZZZ6_9HYPO|nr:hypothetical protein HIM_12537 [Hirsutella minnesotensis 3608]